MNNFADFRNLSDSERALESVKVSTKGLPPFSVENSKFRRRTIRNRRRNTRNALIYRDWLKAEDKSQAVKSLSERWGLGFKRIAKIIADEREFGVSVATHAAEVEAIRQVKTDQTLQDADEYWEYMQDYIAHLVGLKAGGHTSVWVEETTTTGKVSKEGADLPEVKTKEIPIDDAIKKAYQLKAQAAKMDSETLTNYIGRPAGINIKDSNVLIVEADEEFKKHFQKVTGKNEEIIDADATVVDSASDTSK